MLSKSIAVTLLALAVVPAAQAHDFWFEVAGGKVYPLYGHPGDVASADKGRVIELAALGGDGKAVSLRGELKAVDGKLSAPQGVKGAAVVAGWYDGGFWVKNAQGFRNTSKLVVPDAQESRWSQKYAKALLPGGDAKAYGQVVGQRFEIVPLADPFTLKAGAPLPVKVLLEGKPLAGVAITAGDSHAAEAEKIVTDASGEAKLPLPAGPVVVAVSHKVVGTAPALADQDGLSATLSFSR